MASRGGRRVGGQKPRHRIYCAGPLFNRFEREEMAEIARSLGAAGFSTFLPHKDGFVFTDVHRQFLREGYEPGEATRLLQQAIFCLDAYEVLEACQGLVLNMNGRVPDEGAVAEAAMAWMAGKVVVAYKSDNRSLILGHDNPLVGGLSKFAKVSTPQEAAYAFAQLFRARRAEPALAAARDVRQAVGAGRRLSRALARCSSSADIVPAIAGLTGPCDRPSRR